MKIIDITHVFDKNTPVYPGDVKTQFIHYKTIEEDFYHAYALSTSLHTGTHIDIPMHLLPDERMVKDYNPEDFIGNGVVLDVRGETSISMKPEYKRMIKEKDIVLLYTGFDECYKEEKYFTDYPIVSDELGDFLIARKIKMLGMDLPAPDYFPFDFHKKLLSNGIFILENATNLVELLELHAFEVIALPLKIAAEASLVRAICREKLVSL